MCRGAGGRFSPCRGLGQRPRVAFGSMLNSIPRRLHSHPRLAAAAPVVRVKHGRLPQ